MNQIHKINTDLLFALKTITKYSVDACGVHLKDVGAYRQALAAIEQAEGIQSDSLTKFLWREHAASFALSKLLHQEIVKLEGICEKDFLLTLYGIDYTLSEISSRLLDIYNQQNE